VKNFADLRTKFLAELSRMRRGGIEALQMITALMYGFCAAFMAGSFLLICVIRPTPLPTMLTDWLTVAVRQNPLAALVSCCLVHGCAGLIIGWRIGDFLHSLAATRPKVAAAILYPVYFLPFAVAILANMFARYGAVPANEARALAIIGLSTAFLYSVAVRHWLYLRSIVHQRPTSSQRR